MMMKNNVITIELEGRGPQQVPRAAYVRLKTKDLREFGYSNLTEKVVEAQLDLLLDGKEPTDVVGHFIQRDLVLPEAPKPQRRKARK